MFAKLLKYEWKATAGLLGVLSLAAMGVGAVAAVLWRFSTAWKDQVPDAMWAPIWTIIGGAMLAIFAYAIGSQLVLLVRFYKNKFTDEGYLTFTLPVSCHQVLLSSLLNYLIWTVITSVVAFGTMLLVVLIGTTKEGLISTDGWDSMTLLLREMWQAEGMSGYMVLSMVNVVVSMVSTVVVVHTAITLGAVLAKKHKVLAAVGCYYGINMIISVLSSMLSFSYMIVGMSDSSFFDSGNVFRSMNYVVIMQMILYGGIAVAGYFVSHWLMKRKLNLP